MTTAKKIFPKIWKRKISKPHLLWKIICFFEKAFLFFDFCEFSTIKTKSAVFFLTFFKNILIITVKSTIKSEITEFQDSKIPHLMKIILITHFSKFFLYDFPFRENKSNRLKTSQSENIFQNFVIFQLDLLTFGIEFWRSIIYERLCQSKMKSI